MIRGDVLTRMREVLLAQLEPALQQVAEQLVSMLLERLNQHVNQLELAFDAATSAFASDLSVTDGAARRHDVRTKRQAAGSRAQRRSGVDSPTEIKRERDEAATTEQRERGIEMASRAASNGSAPSPRSMQPLVNPALKQGQDLPPSTSSITTAGKPRQRAVMRCKNCGELGKRSDSCGITHNISTSLASAPSPAIPSSPATSSISRSPAQAPRSVQAPSRAAKAVGASAGDLTSRRPDLFAEIEAAQQRRETARLEREARAKSFIRKPTAAPANSDAPDPDDQAEPELPTTVHTFEF